MSQIEITVLKQGIPGKKVLSCSLFKMSSAYRDFSKYEAHFKQFLEYAEQNLPDFVVRVYTDDSAKEECLRLSNGKDYVSVYHYNCPLLKDGTMHIGIFGMFPRFLPLFEDGLDIVWISDIDITNSFLTPNLIPAMKRANADVYINTKLCSERKPWLNVKYPIIAHKIVSFRTFPRQLLTRFLTKLITGDFDEFVSRINEYNVRKTPSKIPYGLDEAFLNSSLYGYMKRNDFTIFIHKDYFSINNLFTHKIKDFPEQYSRYLKQYYYMNQDPTLFPKSKAIFLKSIPLLVDDYPCMQEFLDVAADLKTSFVKSLVIPSSEL